MKQIEKQTIEVQSKIRQRVANGDPSAGLRSVKKNRATSNELSPAKLTRGRSNDMDYIGNEEIINAEVNNIKKKMDLLKLLA